MPKFSRLEYLLEAHGKCLVQEPVGLYDLSRLLLVHEAQVPSSLDYVRSNRTWSPFLESLPCWNANIYIPLVMGLTPSKSETFPVAPYIGLSLCPLQGLCRLQEPKCPTTGCASVLLVGSLNACVSPIAESGTFLPSGDPCIPKNFADVSGPWVFFLIDSLPFVPKVFN